MRRHYQTQWAGQFGVAHELTRRGYLVTFTTGNAPGDDLLCQSPSGVAFSIQVKSLSSKTYFLYQKSLEENPLLGYNFSIPHRSVIPARELVDLVDLVDVVSLHCVGTVRGFFVE
jgi:hypothetical protein